MKMPVQLQGVPETLLWTLYHRAERGAPQRRGPARPQGRRVARLDRLPVRRALRLRTGGLVAVAGAARAHVRPPGRALPREASRRDGRRTRRGTRDAVLARRQRPRPLAHGRPARGDRGARAAAAAGGATAHPGVLGTRRALDGRPGQEARRPRHGARPADVPRARRSPEGDHDLRAADPRRRARLRRRAALAQRAQPCRETGPPRRLAPAALEVVDRRERRRARCARARTSRGCRGCACRAGVGP